MRSTLLIVASLALVAFWPSADHFSSAQPAPVKGLAVHEWGVVSVYTDLELANADARDEWAGLPKFVYGQVDDREQPVIQEIAKAPVIYFHAPRQMYLNVQVQFPGGRPAVWWPASNNAFRQQGQAVAEGAPPNGLQWTVDVKSTQAANVKPMTLPKGHWMEALRAVKADDVLVQYRGPQLERFIYYDGMIKAPKGLAVGVKGDTISLHSQAKHLLHDVTVVDLRNLRKIRTAHVDKMEPGAEIKEVKLIERDQTKWPHEGVEELVGQLKGAGLNEDEAKALANVWRRHFFETEGVSVFYRVPQELYDQVLPLTVTPQPERIVRTLLVHHPHCEPDLGPRVLVLVKELEAEKLEQRIEAQRRLNALGRAAFIHLVRARKEAQDPEVKARLTKLLEDFEAEKAFK